MLSILRDDVPSLRALLKNTSARLVQSFEVERYANNLHCRGPALGCRRACPATRDAGERPRCTYAALPSLRYACSGGACCPAAVVSLVSSPPIPAADDETSKEALSLSNNGLRGNMHPDARSAPQTITIRHRASVR
jgi:hypothetical protein